MRLISLDSLGSREEIKKALSHGKIVIDRPIPQIRKMLGPYFLTLTIGKIKIPKNPSMRSEICVDFTQPKTLEEKFETPDKEKVFLHPNPRTFLRVETKQLLGIPTDLIAQVTIPRKFTRHGLEPIGGTEFLEPGFIDRVVVDVKNSGNRPIALSFGLPAFKVTFKLLSSCIDITP